MASASTSATEDPIEVLQRTGAQLLALISDLPTEAARIKSFVKEYDAQAWLQDPRTGWTALHYAALRNDWPLAEFLIRRANAKWEIVDHTGASAADLAYSLNYADFYQAIVAEGTRAQVLRTMMENMPEDEDMDDDEQAEEEGTEQAPAEGDQQQQQLSSASDLDTYLQSKLIFAGEGDREVCLDAEGNGVMMGWERDIMRRTADLLCHSHPGASQGLRVLNIGHGLGIVDEYLQQFKPSKHVIVEAHPDVLRHMRDVKRWAPEQRPGVEVFEGRWQDWLQGAVERGEQFDVVYWDTFSEHYKDLYAFFERLPDILATGGRFSFFHGLGATNRSFYDIYTNVSEFHLKDLGLQTEWHVVDVPDGGEVRWEGVVRRYWDLPEYRLPLCVMQQEPF